jgi:hypothetical protein
VASAVVVDETIVGALVGGALGGTVVVARSAPAGVVSTRAIG